MAYEQGRAVAYQQGGAVAYQQGGAVAYQQGRAVAYQQGRAVAYEQGGDTVAVGLGQAVSSSSGYFGRVTCHSCRYHAVAAVCTTVVAWQ